MSKTSDTTSVAVAFKQFRIQVEKKEIQDFKDEMSQLEDKKQTLMKLQEQLREEQKRCVVKVNKQIKEQERNLEQRQREDEEQVKHTTQENLEIKQEQEKQLEELRCKLARLQVQVEELKTERQEWLQYKNEGSMKDHRKIEKLEKDTDLSKKIFQELSAYFQKFLEETEQNEAQITENTDQLTLKKAVENRDNASKTLTQENVCLIEQISINIMKVAMLESTVQQLEEENLEHVDNLFQILRMDDPLISQDDEFLAQSASLGSHDTRGTDRNIMKISLEETSELDNRPSFSLQPLEEAEEAQQERDGTSPSTPPDLRETFSSQTNFTEPMHLDLWGRRLLCVIGKASPLHAPTDVSEEMTFDLMRTAKWPVTSKIIHSKFLQSAAQSEERDVSVSNRLKIQQLCDD